MDLYESRNGFVRLIPALTVLAFLHMRYNAYKLSYTRNFMVTSGCTLTWEEKRLANLE